MTGDHDWPLGLGRAANTFNSAVVLRTAPASRPRFEKRSIVVGWEQDGPVVLRFSGSRNATGNDGEDEKLYRRNVHPEWVRDEEKPSTILV